VVHYTVTGIANSIQLNSVQLCACTQRCVSLVGLCRAYTWLTSTFVLVSYSDDCCLLLLRCTALCYCLMSTQQTGQWQTPQCEGVYSGSNIRATCPITVMPAGCCGIKNPILCCMTNDGTVLGFAPSAPSSSLMYSTTSCAQQHRCSALA
jgi:hypothetical protein